MKNNIIILFCLMAINASAQRVKQQDQATTDLKNQFATGAIIDVVGKGIIIGGIITIIREPENKTDGIVLIAIGGGCSIIGTVFTIKGMKSAIKVGQTKNGVGLTFKF
jgi:hypothetical protein